MLENDMISCKNGQKKFGITRRCNPPPTGLAHFWGKVIPPLVTPCPSRESNPRPWLGIQVPNYLCQQLLVLVNFLLEEESVITAEQSRLSDILSSSYFP